MSYREYLPSPVLRRHVDCYWHYKATNPSAGAITVQRCLPLGTVEIIIQVNHKPCQILSREGIWENSPNIYFTGLFTDTAFWKSLPDTMMFGIRLKPESLIELFKVPAVLLFNSVVDAEALLGKIAGRMYDEMTRVSDSAALVQTAEKYLLTRLYNLKEERNYVAEACRLIRNSKGGLSVEAISKNLYISERQLQRSFKENFGASPKTYQRIVRFRNAYQYVRTQVANNLKWADVSYESGYADQAHFIRDFKEFTGEAPSFLTQNTACFFQTLESCKGTPTVQ